MEDVKRHGAVIKKFYDCQRRLRVHGLTIINWGRLAVAEIENKHQYIVNNLDTIEEVESFCAGIEYANKKE